MPSSDPAPGRHRAAVPDRRSPRAVLAGAGLVVVLATGLAVALAVPTTGGSHRPAGPAIAVVPAATPPAADWTAVVRELMRRRAEAYVTGRPAGLARVHQAGSPAMVADRAMLRAWTARGLRVDDALVRVAAARPLRRSPGRVVLRVVHRLGPAVAVGPYGGRRLLPRDQPTAHRVVLTRTAGGWRVAAVSG